MAPVADLHVHTTASDGTMTLDELIEAAHDAGLTAVAITDHDRLHPALSTPVAQNDGITLIRGIELRVTTNGFRFDLLAYGVEPTTALTNELDRLQRDRIERGTEIIARVERSLEIDLDIEPRPGLGRPHIARAIEAHPDTNLDVEAAFHDLIGDGRPCYVPRRIPNVDRGIEILTDAAPIVALAHPLRYEHPQSVLEFAPRVDAIERWYPYSAPVDQTPVDTALNSHDLLPTGGSDAHEPPVGRTGLDATAYARVSEQLPEG